MAGRGANTKDTLVDEKKEDVREVSSHKGEGFRRMSPPSVVTDGKEVKDNSWNRKSSVTSQNSRDSYRSFISCKSHTARLSVSSTWFDTPNGASAADVSRLLNMVDQKDQGAGFVADFMERSRASEQRIAARKPAREPLSPKTIERQLLKEVADPQFFIGSRYYPEFKDQVQFEKMVDAVMVVIIKYWRNRKDIRWAPRTVSTFASHAVDIVKGKRKKKALDIEVAIYDSRYKKKHEAIKGKEHQDERHDRLKDFLKSYHASPSKVDLQMSSSGGGLKLVDHNPKAAHAAFSRSSGRKQTSAPTLESFPKIHERESPISPKKADRWKTRGARHHTSPGMELPRQICRELATMPALPPASAGRPRSTSSTRPNTMSATWSHAMYTPSAGGSSTLTGGWGLQRLHTTGGMAMSQNQSSFGEMTIRTPMSNRSHSSHWSRVDEASRGTLESRRFANTKLLPLSKSAPTLSGSEWLGPSDPYGSSSSSSPSRQKVKTPFASPWRRSGETTDNFLPVPESPTDRYLREAELNFISPKLLPFVTGHSNGLQAKNQALSDCDLLVIGTMLPQKEITEVDLCGNTLLTEKSLVPFLNKLFEQRVERLSLNHCLHYALPPGIKETLDVVSSLLVDDRGLKFLRFLDLSGIAIGTRTHVPLCHAIQEHTRLIDVSLADTGIGGSVAKQCISQLMSSTSIQVLDLSWNSFDPEVFVLLGERLAGNYNLLSLRIASSSSSQPGLDNPVAYFLEYLSRNTRLTDLNISVNRITFRGALVLEDALEQHKKLADLTISHNPIGVLGLRCLFRVLSRDSSGLVHFNGEGVAGGTIMEAAGENMQIFRAISPGGQYKLNLSRPYHRALLRMLYKICERFSVSPDLAFTELAYTNGAYTHARKDGDGIYDIPKHGTLSFNLMPVAASAESGPLKGVPFENFGTFLNQYEAVARLKVGFKKIVPMMSYWKKLEGRAADQVYMLESLGKDFAFTWDQVEQLCRCRPVSTDILWRLMPCIIGGPATGFLPTRLAINLTEYGKVHRMTASTANFNAENPTGHYIFQLDNPNDFFAAERVVLLDRWEMQVDRRLGHADISQRGNRSHVRNEKFQDVLLFNVRSVTEWALPEWDAFELDYVSGKRPPRGMVEIDQQSWENVLVAAQQAACSPELQVLALRKVSHHFYVSSAQVRLLLSLFKEAARRIDIFVTFYLRITDMCNEKMARVRFESRDVQILRSRLGHLTSFPFIQPEQCFFRFDFRFHDERLAMNTLLLLSQKERPDRNIHEPVYWHIDGTKDELPLGVPPSWGYYEKIPTSGTFYCTYMCAPEDRKIADRARIIEQFGFWEGPSSGEDVNWWSALICRPESKEEDVLDFVEFLVTRYDNVYDAFSAFDGPIGIGNKVITLREFEDGLVRMGCRKFIDAKGKRNMQRIQSVFRYLDPSGEGTISMQEWGVLEQLFKETYLTIREFVWFFDRTFEDLAAAWDFVDADASGGLDFAEWTVASEKIGYYGPSKPIFSYLDKEDRGSISWPEFQELKNFGKYFRRKSEDEIKEGHEEFDDT